MGTKWFISLPCSSKRPRSSACSCLPSVPTGEKACDRPFHFGEHRNSGFGQHFLLSICFRDLVMLNQAGVGIGDEMKVN